MTTNSIHRCRASLCAAFVSLLVACGGSDQASYVASAKSYLAKSDYKAAIIQLKNAIQGAPNDPESRFLLAKALLGSRDAVGAETEARKALDLNYAKDSVYPLLARALLAQGKAETVVRELGPIKLDTTQGRTDLGTSMAVAQAAVGNNSEAMAAIDAVLREVPTDSRALVAKAQMVAYAGKLADAAELIDKALAAAPDDPEASFAKAQLQMARGDRAAALATLEKTVDAHPDSRPAQVALISELVATQKLADAQKRVEKLKTVAPGELGTVYSEALVLTAAGDYRKAKEILQKVLAAAPDHMQALYLSGIVDAQLKSYSTAEAALRRVVARLPNDVSPRKTLAKTYLMSGQPLLAVETLEPLRTSDDPEALQLLGEAYVSAGNLARGREFYERASRLDKDNVAGRVRLAQVRLASGDAERGFKDLEALSQTNPGASQADLALILAHMQRGQYDKALAAIADLEKKQPDNVAAHNLRGAVYLQKRDLKNARASFEKALAKKPGDATAAHNLAMIDVQEGKADDARKRYEAMLAKDPKNERLLLSLAQLTALTRESPEETRAVLDRAIAANPGSPQPRLALVAYYVRLKDTRAALATAQAAQTAFPDNAQVLEALGAAQLAAGEANQAVDTFVRVVRMQPGAPAVLARLAAVQFSAKDYPGAIDSARKALALQPDLKQAWTVLTKAQVAMGRSAAALNDARKLQADQPDNVLGYAIEGELMAGDKRWKEAAKAFGEGYRRQPRPGIAAAYYLALDNAGEKAEAKAFAERWARERPTDTTVTELLALQSVARKEYPAAIAQYRAVLAVRPDNSMALNNLAYLLSEAGDPKAREYAERAYQLQPFNPNVVDTLGWTLFKTGDVARGTQLLRLASNLAPNEQTIRMHLAQALVKNGDKEGAKRALSGALSQPADSAARIEAEKILAGR